MRNLLHIAALSILTTSVATANEDGNAKVLTMLKRNTIVNAAVDQAKKFSGAKKCSYTVKAQPLPQFQKGTAYDYSAEITCSSNNPAYEAAGIIRINGQMLQDSPQDLSLTIFFVG
jgi:hypothetical protein